MFIANTTHLSYVGLKMSIFHSFLCFEKKFMSYSLREAIKISLKYRHNSGSTFSINTKKITKYVQIAHLAR